MFYVAEVLINVSKESADTKVTSSIKPPLKGETGVMQVSLHLKKKLILKRVCLLMLGTNTVFASIIPRLKMSIKKIAGKNKPQCIMPINCLIQRINFPASGNSENQFCVLFTKKVFLFSQYHSIWLLVGRYLKSIWHRGTGWYRGYIIEFPSKLLLWLLKCLTRGEKLIIDLSFWEQLMGAHVEVHKNILCSKKCILNSCVKCSKNFLFCFFNCSFFYTNF